MNFDDTADEAAYRAEARVWIGQHAPDLSILTADERRMWSPRHKAVARAWQATKAEAGYACIAWPEAWGGAGGTAMQEAIFVQEEARAGLQFTYYMTGLQMLLPALLTFNRDPGSLALVPPAVRGDSIWCQLFSEPSSGSDSAAVRCMAVQDGEDWVLDGQKVWNSAAQFADYGLVITRTNVDVPKHQGLTAFWIDMKTPGVDVRPIKMMTGESEFNEVFLSSVRVPDCQRVGEVGGGWKVVIATLMNERTALGGGTGLSWRDIMRLARQTPGWGSPVMEDPAFHEWLADWYVAAEGVRLLRFQTLSQISRGATPGSESSAAKLLWATQTQALASQALDMLDAYGLIDDPAIAPLAGAFQHRFLWAPGLRLGGGTDEIMKNIIAERVLGLPGDIRLDKSVPFKDVPTGA